MRQYLLLILGVSIIFSGSAYAQNMQDVEIIISSSSYNYGEKLDYKIIVSEVTGEDAIIFITNTNGNKSQLLSLLISQEESRIIAPFAFDSVIWSEGTYELELQYSGATSTTLTGSRTPPPSAGCSTCAWRRRLPKKTKTARRRRTAA